MAVQPGPTVKRALREIFGPKWAVEKRGSGANCIPTKFVTCAAHQTLFGWSNWGEMGRGCSTQGVLVAKKWITDQTDRGNLDEIIRRGRNKSIKT